ALNKSSVIVELLRASTGNESTEDVLIDLDQAIAKAVNEKPQYQATEADAVKWLLNSPFDRSNGGVRKKVIAVTGAKQNENAKRLQALGFQVVTIGNTSASLQEQAFNQLADVPYDIDHVWITEEAPADVIEQLITKQGKILWAEYS